MANKVNLVKVGETLINKDEISSVEVIEDYTHAGYAPDMFVLVLFKNGHQIKLKNIYSVSKFEELINGN